MGERAGVLIKTEDDYVFLYTHWYGSKIISDVQRGLKKFCNAGRDILEESSRIAGYIFKEMVDHYRYSDLMSATITAIGLNTLESYGLNPLGRTSGEIYKEITKYFWDLGILIVIDSNDLLIFMGKIIEETNLKDFMVKQYPY